MVRNITPPPLLATIPKTPEKLFLRGADLASLLERPRVAIVGSRKVSHYGKEVTYKLAHDLARQGVVIVSGLALGIDAIAHQAALDAGGLTIAVLPRGVDKIYPSSNSSLGTQIIASGGIVLSEYEHAETQIYKPDFLHRNRLISGLSSAVIVTEASERSGSLNTAGHAERQGRPVYAVPGNITSPLSGGTNRLIAEGKATALLSAQQILADLHISGSQQQKRLTMGDTEAEQAIIDLIQNGISDASELLAASGLPAPLFNQTLTMLELKGVIRPLGNNQWGMV